WAVCRVPVSPDDRAAPGASTFDTLLLRLRARPRSAHSTAIRALPFWPAREDHRPAYPGGALPGRLHSDRHATDPAQADWFLRVYSAAAIPDGRRYWRQARAI